MKAIFYCTGCKERKVLLTTIGTDKMYDIKFAWVCPACKKVNDVILENLSG